MYPAEVEEVLATHPDVARAAVVGAPDDVLGEIGVAVVVAGARRPAPTSTRSGPTVPGSLSDYKAPDALVLVDELPLTPMMKVDPNGLGLPGRARGRPSGGPPWRHGTVAPTPGC